MGKKKSSTPASSPAQGRKSTTPTQDVASPAPAAAAVPAGPGVDLLNDVFRRADKNDDGRLTLDEFRGYFEDSLLGTQIEEVFADVDVDGSGEIDISELQAYFRKHFEPFSDVFAGMEDLNARIMSLLKQMAKTYPQAGWQAQFCSRFLLREAVNHLESIEDPVFEALRAFAGPTSMGSAVSLGLPETRARTRDEELEVQINRLRDAVDQLQQHSLGQLSAELARSTIEPAPEPHRRPQADFVLVRRSMTVAPTDAPAFVRSLAKYLSALKGAPGCFHAYVQKPTEDDSVVFEIWQSAYDLADFQSSGAFKAFAKDKIDLLAGPEATSTMPTPPALWVRNTGVGE